MSEHAFIFSPGIWNGQGKVTFSSSPDIIHFFTQWEVLPRKDNRIEATQKVEMQGADETLLNRFVFSSLTEDSFEIELNNELLGTVTGNGVLDAKQFGWEFRGHPTFEGFEVYRRDDRDDYHVHAEYASPDQYRTIIDGRIWKRVE